MKSKKKKIIATHILGLTGVGILWFIVNQILDSVLGKNTWYETRGRERVSYSHDFWDTDIDDDGGPLLLGMLIGYIVVYWAVKTIWFDKDKEEESK
jgi:hypothetical protein